MWEHTETALRRVEVCGSCDELSFVGYFHQWITADNGCGSLCIYGIIENEDGRIIKEEPRYLRFLGE